VDPAFMFPVMIVPVYASVFVEPYLSPYLL